MGRQLTTQEEHVLHGRIARTLVADVEAAHNVCIPRSVHVLHRARELRLSECGFTRSLRISPIVSPYVDDTDIPTTHDGSIAGYAA
jgi:hypothetical protein